LEILQSQLSQSVGQSENEDGSPTGHGTGTASKATGEKLGSAKKAKLVVFKMAHNGISEMASAFESGTFQFPALVLRTMIALARNQYADTISSISMETHRIKWS